MGDEAQLIEAVSAGDLNFVSSFVAGNRVTPSDAIVESVLAVDNLEAFQIIFRSERGTNWSSSKGEPLLCQCAEKRAWNIAKHLIANGWDVNVPSVNRRRPPLSIAIRHGQRQIFEALTSAGCDINKADLDGYTPLHGAVSSGQNELVKRLIQLNCKVNELSTKDERISALHLACSLGDLSMVRLLLTASCGLCSEQALALDVDLPSGVNLYTALHFAVMGGHVDIVEELVLAHADTLAKSRRGTTPLSLCVASSKSTRLQMADVLLRHGGGASSAHLLPGSHYRSSLRRHSEAVPLSVVPLHAALHAGDEDMVELLLRHDDVDLCERGAPLLPAAPVWVHAEGGGGHHPSAFAEGRHKAAHEGISVLTACLSNGRSVMMLDRIIAEARRRGVKPDAGGWHTLVAAVQWPRHMRKLLDFGLDVSVLSSFGRTILHEEDCLLRPQSVALLMQMGASSGERMGASTVLMDVAVNQYASAEGSAPLHVLAAMCDRDGDLQAILETATILIDYGADVNARDIRQSSPLMIALDMGRLAIAEYLVDRGAKLMPIDLRRLQQSASPGTCTHVMDDATRACGDCQLRTQQLLNSMVSQQMHDVDALSSLCIIALRSQLIRCRSLPISAAARAMGLPVTIARMLSLSAARCRQPSL